MKMLREKIWPQNVKELIRLARGGVSQKKFANELGVSQSSISKYEKGEVSPPAYIIDACLARLKLGSKGIPDASELAARVACVLEGPEYVGMRRIVEQLLSAQIVPKPGRPRRQNGSAKKIARNTKSQ